MSDVLRFFGVLPPPALRPAVVNSASGSVTLTWSASAGLTYRVEYKTNLTDAIWQTLSPDITATNTTVVKTDSSDTAPRRFYRIRLVN